MLDEAGWVALDGGDAGALFGEGVAGERVAVDGEQQAHAAGGGFDDALGPEVAAGAAAALRGEILPMLLAGGGGVLIVNHGLDEGLWGLGLLCS